MAEKSNLSFEDMIKMSNGTSGSYFSLKDNEEALIRILYNSYEDVKPYIVHEFMGNKDAGTKGVTIMCNAGSDNPDAYCKWCDGGSPKVPRIVIPFFNVDKGEIQYFKRTASWFAKSMKPYTDEIIKQGFPIASQVYKIKRSGSDKNTTYSLISVGSPDGKKAEDFGTIKSAVELGAIKPYDFEYSQDQAAKTQYGDSNQTRRTTNTFTNVTTADTF